ncbi:arsenate reductase [Rubricella aquisinus]|uniref:Arsenate reductase n=1 Tax=Rubricella aquisinus TaxID=2028108 RepID=A0A840WZ44_9RHOB|nr:Spx/MgsR family RNA polymerase-binding regulatory protein [Rubricella aquisinus]MBB5515694.1 arsenate reductase [Rubricella aquisinus]
MIFIGLKTCDTCRKARKALDAAGVSYDAVDIRADGLTEAQIETIIAGAGRAAAINTRSTTWRGLTETERAQAGDDASAVRLLMAHPTLMRRPVIMAEDAIHLGWTPAVQSKLGL